MKKIFCRQNLRNFLNQHKRKIYSIGALTAFGTYYSFNHVEPLIQLKKRFAPGTILIKLASKQYEDVLKKYRICFVSGHMELNNEEKKIYPGVNKKYFCSLHGIINGRSETIARFVMTDDNKVIEFNIEHGYYDLLPMINYIIESFKSSSKNDNDKYDDLYDLARKLENEHCLNFVQTEIPKDEIKKNMVTMTTDSGKEISINVDELKNYYARTQNLMSGLFKYLPLNDTYTHDYNLNIAINPCRHQIPFNGAHILVYDVDGGVPRGMYTPLGYLEFNYNYFKHGDIEQLKEKLGLIELFPAGPKHFYLYNGKTYLITKDFSGNALPSYFTKDQLRELDDPISYDSAKQLWKLVRPKVRINLIE